jgi:hypothetical protein
VNCLHEWETGSWRRVPFTGVQYDAVYARITDLVNKTLGDRYHGRKLERLLTAIATDALLVYSKSLHHVLIFFCLLRSQLPTRRGNGAVHNFDVTLD